MVFKIDERGLLHPEAEFSPMWLGAGGLPLAGGLTLEKLRLLAELLAECFDLSGSRFSYFRTRVAG